MPRRKALHHHRPAVGPASRLLWCYPSHNQPPLPPDADWRGAALALPELRGAFLAPGYVCAPRPEWLCRYRDTMLPKGAHVWYRGDNGLWWLEKNQCEYDGGWGIPRPNFGRSGAVQAPSFPGALHDLRGGRTRFLVPSGSRSQRVLSGGSNVR